MGVAKYIRRRLPVLASACSGTTNVITHKISYARYCEALKTYNGLDFDDLILPPGAAVQAGPETNAALAAQDPPTASQRQTYL